MSRLLIASFRYRLRMILWVWGGALAIAALVNILLPIFDVGPPAEDDFKLVYFFPIAVVFASLATGMASISGDAKESRAFHHTLLPVTRGEVSLARILAAVLHPLTALLVAELMMLAAQLGLGVSLAAWRFSFLACFATGIVALLQFILLVDEFQACGAERRWMHLAMQASLLLLVFLLALRVLIGRLGGFGNSAAATRVKEILTLDPESWTSSAFLLAVALFLAGLNHFFFVARRTVAPR